TGTFLGAVGLLSGYALLGSTAALSGGLLWLARRPGGANRAWRGSAAPVTSPAPETAAGGSAGAGNPTGADADGQPGRPAWEWCWPALWGGGLAFALSTVILDGLLAFPSQWDTLAYHLPIIDQWLRAQSLYVPDQAVWFVPGNNELLGVWLTAPFSGDFWI